MIRVLNKHSGCRGEYIGRGSPLGNPFVIGRDGDREEVIALYESWLAQRLAAKDAAVCAEMNRLWRIAKAGDLSLVCFCAPKRCHGEVIRKLLEAKL